MVIKNFQGMYRTRVVDTALNNHIKVKAVGVQIKELVPVVEFDQLDTLSLPELFQ